MIHIIKIITLDFLMMNEIYYRVKRSFKVDTHRRSSLFNNLLKILAKHSKVKVWWAISFVKVESSEMLTAKQVRKLRKANAVMNWILIKVFLNKLLSRPRAISGGRVVYLLARMRGQACAGRMIPRNEIRPIKKKAGSKDAL